MSVKTIGENIKHFRNEAGLTQKELGIQIGKKERTVRGYEANNTTPSLDMLIKIASVLKTDLISLTGTNNIIDSLGIEPDKIYTKEDADGNILMNIDLPYDDSDDENLIPLLASDDSDVLLLKYIEHIAHKNNFSTFTDETSKVFNRIKPALDLLITTNLQEILNDEKGARIK